MIEREFRVLRALEGTGFPAPRALALCEDESVDPGTAFYVMAHVDGRIFWDPALPELEREAARPGLRRDERGARADSTRSTSPRPAFPTSASPAIISPASCSAGASNIGRARRPSIADMDRLIDWLGENVPADDGRVALVHGDWRIDNMIFDAHAPEPAGRARLGTFDARPSLRRPRLSVHAMAAAERRAFRGLARRRPRRAPAFRRRTSYVAAYCRRAGLDGDAGLDLPDRLQLLPRRGDRAGRLQALARRQRLEPGAGRGDGRRRSA